MNTQHLPDPDDQAIQRAYGAELVDALRRLPPLDRYVLILSYGLSGQRRLSDMEIGKASHANSKLNQAARQTVYGGVASEYGWLDETSVDAVRRRALRALGLNESLKEFYEGGVHPAASAEYIPICDGPKCNNFLIVGTGVGRPRRYCSAVCRQAAYRARRLRQGDV